MKLIKIGNLIALTLVVSFALVGCKAPQRLTPLPGTAMANPPGPNDGGGKLELPPTVPPVPFIDTNVKPVRPEVDTGGGRTTDKPLNTWPEDPDQIYSMDTVHFDFDKAVVKAVDMPKLQHVAGTFKNQAGKALRIEGHCDERGTEEYNRSLGERRALAVREALVRLGLDPQFIDTISYGEDRPEDPGHNAEAWAKNRRGRIVLLRPPGAN